MEVKEETTFKDSLKETSGINNNMIVSSTYFGVHHLLDVSPAGRRGFRMIILTPSEDSK